MYRIYVRSRERSRGFTPIAWYCDVHKIFQPDKAIEREAKIFAVKPRSFWPKRFKGHKITPEEAGLRTRIKNLKKLYENHLRYRWRDKSYDWGSNELIEKFLALPPTITELRYVLFSSELVLKLNSQNHLRAEGYIPHPDKPGWMKRDSEGYVKLVKEDALKQKQMMERIIDSRINIPLEQEQVSG